MIVEFKGTPGPWKLFGGITPGGFRTLFISTFSEKIIKTEIGTVKYNHDEFCIIKVKQSYKKDFDKTLISNMFLMASAPDLLDALNNLIAENTSKEPNAHKLLVAIEKGKKAIAKALNT